VLIHGIEIDGAIAMVVGDRLSLVDLFLVQAVVVVIDWVQPYRCYSEVFQIGQSIDDPPQIAAVVVARF
jgi:hypothetical protein